MGIKVPSMTRQADPASLAPGHRLAQLRRPGGQQRHRLRDVAPCGSGADAEPGRQLRKRLALAEMGQHQQRLLTRVELAPA